MNCGCTKDLGCFVKDEIINFGVVNPTGAPLTYTAEIYSVAGYTTQDIEVAGGAAVTLPFDFNEAGETLIKLNLPASLVQSGINYVTTPDGACCFAVHGKTPVC